MSLPGMKAPGGSGGIRQWLSAVVLLVVALVLTLVVISLCVGSSLPGISQPVYLGRMNDTAADFLLSGGLFQGIQEPLPEQNSQSGTMNSSEASLDTGEVNRKMPEPVATGTCDLYRGEWFFDSLGPLYTNNSCPVITKTQNCQGNGRPDKGYENWRWKPEQCILPRFDARKFLELMRGKTLAFVGDSVARNQMESLLRILWQVDTPVNNGTRRMQKWIFRSTSTIIIHIWSSWLVHRSTQAVEFAPDGFDKVFLDIPDETFMEFLPSFDVLVLSSGHWFAKRSAYILNGNIVGGQLWWPREAGNMRMDNIDALGLSVETCLTAVATNPDFKGIAVLRTYSPDHYEGGAWNTKDHALGRLSPWMRWRGIDSRAQCMESKLQASEKLSKILGNMVPS